MDCTFNHPPSPRPSGWQGHARKAEKQEQDAEYPRRAGEPDCSYYVKFGSCNYGMNCMFNHPRKPSGWQGRHACASEKQEQDSEYPRRPGEPDCSYYMKFGSCKYEMDCRFNHRPKPCGWQQGRHTPAGERQEHEAEYPQRPGEPDCSYYIKFGSCKYGMDCIFNHPHHEPMLFPGKGCKCNYQGGGKTEFEKVKLNFLGLPLRQGTGVCSYYMRTGICKFGTNCKFHHPEPGLEHENWEAPRQSIQGSSQQNFYAVLHREELKEQPVPLSASSASPRRQGIILPQGTNPPYPESSEYQFGGSRCNTDKGVRYTRDELLGLRQVQTQAYSRYDLKDNREWRSWSSQTPKIFNEEKSWNYIKEAKESYASSGPQEHGQLSIQFDSKAQGMMHCGKCIAPLIVRLPNTMSGKLKMIDSSSRAPEDNLAVSDENYVGTVDKDVHNRSEEVILRESSNEEPNSVKPQQNYVNEESSHMDGFGSITDK
ncbi:hypothetical protein PR202_ga30283 [Eleusine coracana subsp. coracana]|uniref:C3H1-type domain-containing protein n=1 Tax=Eleusine coracana subsp. coracana TaxID=191504 RepID=A0AAV5DQ77_ELECO|nr:hypothetical protein PR202_ga30283 [Eleusine coracana subsp. coracana]